MEIVVNFVLQIVSNVMLIINVENVHKPTLYILIYKIQSARIHVQRDIIHKIMNKQEILVNNVKLIIAIGVIHQHIVQDVL